MDPTMNRPAKPLKPVLKWAGGKRQLLSRILPYIPENLDSKKYFEPFVGGGSIHGPLPNKGCHQ